MPSSVSHIRNCSIWRAMEILGDKPSLLITESYWLGARRFDEFTNLTGLSKTVISNRLKRFCDEGGMKKVPYSQKPLRHEYKATSKLYDVYTISLCMLHWEWKWNITSEKVGFSLIHKTCGHSINPTPVCSQCRNEVKSRQVVWEPGPGQKYIPANYIRRRRTATTASKPTFLFDESAEIVGDRWLSLITRSLLMGYDRFDDILKDCGIATNILTDRLVELSDRGIIHKIHHGRNVGRTKYRLTKKGRDLYPIFMAINEWGNKWYPDADGPPVIFRHQPCGTELSIDLSCSTCWETINIGDLTVFPKADSPVVVSTMGTSF